MKSKVSIIILSYNSLEETTKPCIESIYNCRTHVDFETIVVDNLSIDGTRAYLLRVCNSYRNFRIILNDKNYGFAGGNNLGIKSSNADYYILLNSDTIVTDYWIDKIVDFFKDHQEAGLAGPVSNSVGNEQCIYIKSTSEDDIMREGTRWSEKYKKNFFYTSMLGFFCVAIKKEVIEKVGLLDENYGLGMFEDNDYCIRVIQNGYKLACLEDVFIYHKGSVSFSKLGNKSDEIFFDNLKKFEDKFKVKWKSHLNNDTFISVILQYLEVIEHENIDGIKEKIQNRLEIMKNFDYASKNLECIDFWKQTLQKDIEINKLCQEVLEKEIEKEFLNKSLNELYNNIKIAQATKAWKIMCLLRRINKQLFKGNFNEKKKFFIWIINKLFRKPVNSELELINFSPI